MGAGSEIIIQLISFQEDVKTTFVINHQLLNEVREQLIMNVHEIYILYPPNNHTNTKINKLRTYISFFTFLKVYAFVSFFTISAVMP